MTDMTERLRKMQIDGNLSYLPTEITYLARLAVAGEGEWAYTWTDKPHRVVYDLCRHIEEAAVRAAALSDLAALDGESL
jgi:hypothetical protein